MIWTAVFLVCSSTSCNSIGSPFFQTREVCELAVQNFGLQAITEIHPDHKILAWKCISFLDVNINA